MPYMFERPKKNNTDLSKYSFNKSIHDLDKKIDELAKIYSKKANIKCEPKDEIDVHGVTEDIPTPTSDPDSSHVWTQMIKPFLEAQYNFLSSYDYKNDGRQPPYYQIERWGSRYNAPVQRRSWDQGRSNQQYTENRPFSQRPRMFNRNIPPNAGTGLFRNSQPKKRLRFSEWVRVNDSGQNGGSSDNPSTDSSPNQSYEDYNQRSKDYMAPNKNNGIKRNQTGDAKVYGTQEVHLPRVQSPLSSTNGSTFKGNFKPIPNLDQAK